MEEKAAHGRISVLGGRVVGQSSLLIYKKDTLINSTMAKGLNFLFGLYADSHTITDVQLMMRAVVIFFATLVLLRLSGKHTFGGSAAFDIVVKTILEAVLSRAVVAASPFVETLLAGLVLVGLHRSLARAAFRSE
jgi:hypothetical protein